MSSDTVAQSSRKVAGEFPLAVPPLPAPGRRSALQALTETTSNFGVVEACGRGASAGLCPACAGCVAICEDWARAGAFRKPTMIGAAIAVIAAVIRANFCVKLSLSITRLDMIPFRPALLSRRRHHHPARVDRIERHVGRYGCLDGRLQLRGATRRMCEGCGEVHDRFLPLQRA